MTHYDKLPKKLIFNLKLLTVKGVKRGQSLIKYFYCIAYLGAKANQHKF
jgi:hypothetical protein